MNKFFMAKHRWKIGEIIIESAIRVSGFLAVLFVLSILVLLLWNGLPLFRFTSVKAFLLGSEWQPLSGTFGILPLILGSLVVTAGAILIAVPLGIAVAVYIAEIASKHTRAVLKPAIETLAAIPSVVIGFVGLLIFAPVVRSAFNLPTGQTAFTGSVVLAFMALPTIISISEDVISAVPNEFRAASLALGATRWQTISRAVVPSARSGILAAVMLGMGRVIGETMAVLMVTGNAAVIPHSVFQPVRTLTATIAAEMGETVQGSPHYFALFAIGLVLFLITLLINMVADVALRKGVAQR